MSQKGLFGCKERLSVCPVQCDQILTPLQKLPKNVGDLGKIIVAKCLKKLPNVQKIAQSGHTGPVAVIYLFLRRFKFGFVLDNFVLFCLQFSALEGPGNLDPLRDPDTFGFFLGVLKFAGFLCDLFGLGRGSGLGGQRFCLVGNLFGLWL